jgi:5-methylthioadenosine/S-adenosylhomocysteine deaminase
MQPVHNIVSNLVYAASGMENRLTVVDGEILYRDGEFKTLDYPRLCHDMRSIRDWAQG